MEPLTLLFVLMLLAAAALLTITIRRDFLAREMLEHERRREREIMRAKLAALTRPRPSPPNLHGPTPPPPPHRPNPAQPPT